MFGVGRRFTNSARRTGAIQKGSSEDVNRFGTMRRRGSGGGDGRRRGRSIRPCSWRRDIRADRKYDDVARAWGSSVVGGQANMEVHRSPCAWSSSTPEERRGTTTPYDDAAEGGGGAAAGGSMGAAALQTTTPSLLPSAVKAWWSVMLPLPSGRPPPRLRHFPQHRRRRPAGRTGRRGRRTTDAAAAATDYTAAPLGQQWGAELGGAGG